jgi:alpha/beta superfamily hydrolase
MTNKKIKIIFSHGQESTPHGSKILAMSDLAIELGFTTCSIDYRGIKSPDDRVKFLLSQNLNDNDNEIILVGSSMGGYTSLVASKEIKTLGIFLLAPALYIENYDVHTYPTQDNCEIVHGWDDDIIPFQNSVRYAQESKCSLHLINGDHRLNSSLSEVKSLFKAFLEQF